MSSNSAGAASPAPAAPLNRRGWLVILFVFALCVGPTLVWPGDGLFFQDEPRLLAMAWHADHDHELATIGLYGNFAVPYGPLATQVYQVLLLVSHDPVVVAFLRTLLCAGGTTAALLWLTRTLGFPPWYVVLVCLVPRMWEFQRLMWDASFAIPVGSLAVAALAANLHAPSRGKLLTAIGAALLVPLIHPQGLPLFGAIAVTLAWKCRAELLRHRVAIAILIAGLLVFNGVYIVRAVDALAHQLTGSVHRGYPKGPSHLDGALAPFCGGILVSDFGFTGGVTLEESEAVRLSAAGLTAYMVIFCSVEIFVLAVRLWSRRGQWAVVETMGGVVLLCLLLQSALFGLMRIPRAPQYFFGTFAAHVLLPWYAIQAAMETRRVRPAVINFLVFLFAGGNGLLLARGMISIHRHGYNPGTHWLTINDTKALALDLNEFSDETAQTNLPLYQRYPQSLRTMRLLLPPTPGAARRLSGHLYLVGGLDPSIPRLKVELTEKPPKANMSLPSKWWREGKFAPMDITPLPKNWVPDPSTW